MPVLAQLICLLGQRCAATGLCPAWRTGGQRGPRWRDWDQLFHCGGELVDQKFLRKFISKLCGKSMGFLTPSQPWRSYQGKMHQHHKLLCPMQNALTSYTALYTVKCTNITCCFIHCVTHQHYMLLCTM